MISLTFYKEGLGLQKNDESKRVLVPYLIKYSMKALGWECHLNEDVTLRDIMTYVRNNEKLCDFISSFICCDLNPWHEFLDKKVEKLDEESAKWLSKIEYISINWTLSWRDYESPAWKMDNKNPREGIYLEKSTRIHGIGEPSEHTKKHCPDLIFDRYAICFHHLERYLDFPLKLNESAEMFNLLNDKNSGGIDENKSFFIPFTFWDILEAIYSEIAWYGTPQRSKEIEDDLKERMKSISEDESREEGTISLEDLMNKCHAEWEEEGKKFSCPKCGDYKKGREIKKYDFKNECGDIFCKACDSIIDKYEKSLDITPNV